MAQNPVNPSLLNHPGLRRVLLLGVPALVLLTAVYLWLFGGRYISTDNAYVKAYMVNVSADVSGKIDTMLVRENQAVKKGELLFRIDPAPYAVAVQQAEAALQTARLQVQALKASYAQKVAELASAQADLRYRRVDQHRMQALQALGATPTSALDAAEHALQVAESKALSAQRDVDELRAQLDGNPDIAVADHPTYANAQAALDKARLELQRTEVRAPIDGIASKVPQVGVYVTPALPVLSVVDAAGPWVEANLKESQLEKVRVGQRVEIDVDAYTSTQWQGVVESIGQATGAEFSLLPPQNASGNWVKVVQRVPVRIRIQHQNDEPALRAGMSSEIRIDTESGRQAAPTQAALR
ncbi:membrane fusion protein, multidrug efflux system [Solimonas aquatica]|uniref:Membrane fusion protein, multidrug efflux system n=1 Tax=Solimonas aquatica TaxID=489703 RepID=A0A1H9GTY6_9GAMM|nr:HlyD family secretion protein [Solimonas aquatica]SEQ53586.1 membrane fusion protein, multidrug efflux system [Solimonas aquatica]